MPSRHRALYGATALVAACALLAAPLAANAADTTQVRPTAIDASAEPVSFTLITGDVVHAYVDANGALTGIRLEGAAGDELWSTWIDGDSTYVIPADVQSLIDAGTLDPRLFDITTLWADGYDDASTDALPVIVEYTDGATARTALKGAAVTVELDAIDADALAVDKDRAAAVWAALEPSADGRSNSDIAHIWLDAKVSGSSLLNGLEPTVPLTGASVAHGLGLDGTGVKVAVLDTGFDQDHPDLQGQVLESRSFVTYYGQTIQDLNGHGTHTASTIAGTGAASDGTYAGMAPGADLLVGKVLADNGSGLTSWILAGMQWAVDEGADIVSMSLGNSSSTSCTGPDVALVEALSDRALFVIAAGNEGLRGQVSTPGCAPSALTVGALDRDDVTANFSSRGPSVGGDEAKPDIASQGVKVVAARSGGGADLPYIAYSGTSMATPHVAGGAALVLQARPDLTPAELKQVLTSSAVSTTAPVLDQGAGPMDVARALTQPVTGEPNVELASFAYPQADLAPETASVTLTNSSAEDITLHLKLDAFGDDGSTVPPAMFSLGVKNNHVVVPANGSVDVPVIIDPAVTLEGADYGTVTGRLVGTRTGNVPVQVTVPFSVSMQAPTAKVTVVTMNRFGEAPDSTTSSFQVINAARDTAPRYSTGSGSIVLSLPYGTYDFVGQLMTRDNPGNYGQVDSVSQVYDRGVAISGDTTVVLDARAATELTWETEQATETRGFSLGYTYSLMDGGQAKTGVLTTIPSYVRHLYTTRTKVDENFTFEATARLVAPGLTMTSSGGRTVDDLPVIPNTELDGEGSAELVYAGPGTAANLAATDVEGKIVLLDASPSVAGGNAGTWWSALRNRGAVAVLAYSSTTNGRIYVGGTGADLPMVTITTADGEALIAELAEGPVTMSWYGTASAKSPYVYNLATVVDGVQPTGVQRAKTKDLAAVPTEYFSQAADSKLWWSDIALVMPGAASVYASSSMLPVIAPLERVEYYTAADNVNWTTISRMSTNLSSAASFDGPRTYEPGSTEPTSWFETPLGSTGNTYDAPLVSRDLNELTMTMSVWGDAAGHDSTGLYYSDSATRRVWVDDSISYIGNGTYTVPAEAAEVKIEKAFTRRLTTTEQLGLAYTTYWTFTTDRDAQGAQALLLPAVDVDMDLTNRVESGAPVDIVLGATSDATGERADLASVTLQYATGTEYRVSSISTWTDVEVTQAADGTWHAVVPTDVPAGTFVHLRTVMTGTDGSTVDQTMVRVYKVR